jgi:predicted nucleic acid-binding protein
MKAPGYLDDFVVIDDVMDVNTRVNIRAAMRPGQPGLFGDGSIGATALLRGSPVVTFVRNFAEVLAQFGGVTR